MYNWTVKICESFYCCAFRLFYSTEIILTIFETKCVFNDNKHKEMQTRQKSS